MASEIYKNKRDRRMKYSLTQAEVLEKITKKHNQSNGKGISYWGGHGNDPYMYQVSTTMKGLDIANGKKTVLVYPEVEDHSDEFNFVMNDLILSGTSRLAAFSQSLFIITGSTLALAYLFYTAEKDKFYPAMPFISVGCFIGLGIVMLI